MLAAYFLVLVLSLLCGVSRQACQFVLVLLRHLSDWLLADAGLSPNEAAFLIDIPRDPRTVLNRLHLDPKLKAYVAILALNIAPICLYPGVHHVLRN